MVLERMREFERTFEPKYGRKMNHEEQRLLKAARKIIQQKWSNFSRELALATFRRKNDVSSGARVGPDRSGALPECALVLPGLFPSPEGSFFPAGGVRLYPFLRLAKTLPILMSVSATTPNPTHRSIPSSPPSRPRLSPSPRFSPLIRPSPPVLHFCPLRNQRFFWCLRRAALWVERFGIETRCTPSARASRSFSAE